MDGGDVRKDGAVWDGQTEGVNNTTRTKKGMRDRESWQGGRQAYHLCVGGHKLKEEREKKKKKKKEEQNKERGSREKEGEGRKEKRIRTKGKMNFRMSQLKKQDRSKTVDMIQINNTEKDAIVNMNGDPM